MKALVVGDSSYAQLLQHSGLEIYLESDYHEDYDVVMFTGGADVSPELYGEARHPSTYTHPLRDMKEVNLYNKHKGQAKFIGICRGAQLLCAMNGDRLVQDISNHGHCDHDIFIGDVNAVQSVINVTGDHHQMMCPDKGELLAYALGMSTHYLDGEGNDNPFDTEGGVEPEVVWYKDTQSLCVQYHPEWMDEASEGRVYFNELLKEYIL